MAVPMRSSPSAFNSSGRQSPFKRQNSVSPAPPVQPLTPTQSPTKTATMTFPSTRNGSLSPEKASPFVRRPSQFGNGPAERPSSPLARPSSSAIPPTSPTVHSRETTPAIRENEITPTIRQRSTMPTPVFNDSVTPSPFDGPASSPVAERMAKFQPLAPRTGVTRSPNPGYSVPTIKPTTPTLSAARFTTPGGYSHVPPGLLRSMRESFEVLDQTNSGTIDSGSVATVLSQVGLDSSPADVRAFFPPHGPAQLNLAKYLDGLCAPLAEWSGAEELNAAFSAFDIDDSGQIDVAELRKALLNTPPEDGGPGMSEADMDGVLGMFSARRAFGAKGLNAAKGKGEVFKYRDFMASVTGGGVDAHGTEAAVAA